MALIKTSALVADISGKVGGNVFSRNKGGSYVRQFVKPVNPNTTKQAAVRSLFGTNMTEWRGLTQAQRQTFIEAAPKFPYTNRLGETKIYSGAQLYSRVNTLAVLNNLPRIESMPASPSVLPVGGTSSKVQGPHPWEVLDNDIVFEEVKMELPNPAKFGIDIWFEVFASAPVSAGIQSVRSVSLKRIGVYNSQSDEFSWANNVASINVMDDWKEVFGEPSFAGAVTESRVAFVEVRIFSERDCFSQPFGTVRIPFDIQVTP